MKEPSSITGTVHGEILIAQQQKDVVAIEVDSSAWFVWLESATSFRFRDKEGHFTAHKTHAGNRRGGSYWPATRRRHGRLYSFYLGTDARLTLPRLREAARDLAVRIGALEREQLTELRAADLRLSSSESETFLQTVTGLNLPLQTMLSLQRRTEGWIACLQLAALSLCGRDDVSTFLAAFTGGHRFVLDYLSAEVLSRLLEPRLSFLRAGDGADQREAVGVRRGSVSRQKGTMIADSLTCFH